MNNFKHANKRKKAGVSIEMALSIILAVGVLFLLLGMFNNNLRAMTSHSGFNSLFKKERATAYSKGEDFRKDAAKSYTNSQVNIRIVAEQGLQKVSDYHDNAIKTINDLAPLGKPLHELTTQQKMNLARALTVLAESGKQSALAELSKTAPNMKISYHQLGLDNGITVSPDNIEGIFITQIEGMPGGEGPKNVRTVDWGENNKYAESNPEVDEKLRIGNLNVINKVFDSFE